MKIKPTFTFPYGYKIHVKILKGNNFIKINGNNPMLACWDQDSQTIYLRDDRIAAELWQDFLHELDHAWTDYREWLRNKVHE